MESGCWEYLGEEINQLIRRRDRNEVNSALTKVLSQKMTINLDMFGVLIEDFKRTMKGKQWTTNDHKLETVEKC